LQAVKTYRLIDASNEKTHFSISKMEALFQNRKGKIDSPHRHDFFTVILIEHAFGEHKIDFNCYPLTKNQVFFVAPGQVHQMIEKDEPKGYAITFSVEFLIENGIELSFIESLNLFHNYGQSPPLQPSEEKHTKLWQYCTEMLELFQGNEKLKSLAIGAYLKLFLIQCNSICSIHPNDLKYSENNTIKTFKHLVNQHYKNQHSTSYYAQEMSISPDHLNRVIKNAIGKTAKDYIQSRIITEAKRLLFFSGMSNKEIGYELGFSEPARFSSFFKKCTGTSPNQFKKN